MQGFGNEKTWVRVSAGTLGVALEGTRRVRELLGVVRRVSQNSCPYLCGFWSRSILRIHSCKFSVSSFFIPVTSPRSSSWELDYFFILKSFSFLSSNCILVSSSSKSFHFSSSSVPHTQSDTGILQALALHSLPLTWSPSCTKVFSNHPFLHSIHHNMQLQQNWILTIHIYD